jgi:phosphopantetheine adenylyltransferase|tara:strand:+ start:987 stop:1142 length:156 start_codon:yes stop_codon:yes gene_type:complete
MNSYKVEFWYRYDGDTMEPTIIDVEAEDEATALKVAKIRAPRGAKEFEIIK